MRLPLQPSNMVRIACAVVALLVVFTAPAGAQLRAVSGSAAGGPVLLDGRVLWAERGAGAARVLSAPAGGGAASVFAAVPSVARDSVELSAGTRTLAVLVRDPRTLAARGRLWTGGVAGGLTAVASNVGGAPINPYVPGLQVSDAGLVTLEGGVGAFLRDGGGGPAREIALPPGADPEIVGVGGPFGVAPSSEGVVVVFDLHTDTEVREISLGRFDPTTVNGVAISPAGDVALTVPIGDGGDVLLWAPAGASHVRELRRGREYSTVATAGGRVAWIGGDGLREGTRVTVIDAATRRTVFRGPPSFSVRSLSFDGRNVAFATASCALVGPAARSASRRTLPTGGGCLRSDAAVNPSSPTILGDRYRVRVACINAPGTRCRVSARLTTRDGRSAGQLVARVPRGGARTLSIPLNARGRAERDDRLRLRVTLRDPDGRTGTVYDS